MIYLMIVQALVIVAAVMAIIAVVRQGRSERENLEDRLMAICHPVAQIQVSKDRSPGAVKYVDEEATTYQLEKMNANSSQT